jgi:hypothetical protein
MHRICSDIVDYITLKSGPKVIAISTVSELESHCNRIHKDSIFGAGIVSVALGLFIPTFKESGEVPLDTLSGQ